MLQGALGFSGTDRRKETPLTGSALPSKPHGLADLVAAATEHLEHLRYAQITVVQYRGMWRSFLRFAAQAGRPDEFSEDLAERFLASHGVTLAGPAPSSRVHVRRAVMWMRSGFSRDGRLHRRRCIPDRVRLA